MIFNINELILTENDYNDFLDLYSQLSIIDYNKFSFDDFKHFTNSLYYNPNHNIYVYMTENKIVGTITLLLEQKMIHNGKYVAHIEDLVIAKEHRNKKIASQLLEYVINISKKNNCYKCILDCVPELCDLYNKNGFQNKGSCMAYYFD